MELAIYEAFREAGIEETPAKQITAAINKAVEHHYSIHSQQTATKGDVEQLRLEIEQLRLETKVEFEKVRAEIEKAKVDIVKWVVGAVFAAAGLAMAIARLFFTAA